MSHTYTNLLIHVIFSTKDRLPHLTPDLKPQLFPYMAASCAKWAARCWRSTVQRTISAHLAAAYRDSGRHDTDLEGELVALGAFKNGQSGTYLPGKRAMAHSV